MKRTQLKRLEKVEVISRNDEDISVFVGSGGFKEFFEELEAKLDACYDSSVSVEGKAGHFLLTTVADESSNLQRLRVEVLSVGEESAKVNLVDYAYIIEVSLDSFRSMPKELEAIPVNSFILTIAPDKVEDGGIYDVVIDPQPVKGSYGYRARLASEADIAGARESSKGDENGWGDSEERAAFPIAFGKVEEVYMQGFFTLPNGKTLIGMQSVRAEAEKMETRLNAMSDAPLKKKCQQGDPVIVAFEGVFCRGLVISVDGDKIVVTHVDYGSFDVVKSSEVYDLLDKEVLAVPQMAVYACMDAESIPKETNFEIELGETIVKNGLNISNARLVSKAKGQEPAPKKIADPAPKTSPTNGSADPKLSRSSNGTADAKPSLSSNGREDPKTALKSNGSSDPKQSHNSNGFADPKPNPLPNGFNNPKPQGEYRRPDGQRFSQTQKSPSQMNGFASRDQPPRGVGNDGRPFSPSRSPMQARPPLANGGTPLSSPPKKDPPVYTVKNLPAIRAGPREKLELCSVEDNSRIAAFRLAKYDAEQITKMNENLSKVATNLPIFEKPIKGDLVTALQDGEFLRAVFLGNAGRSFSVYEIDYGMISEVPPGSLRRLPYEFVTEPPQGIRCRLKENQKNLHEEVEIDVDNLCLVSEQGNPLVKIYEFDIHRETPQVAEAPKLSPVTQSMVNSAKDGVDVNIKRVLCDDKDSEKLIEATVVEKTLAILPIADDLVNQPIIELNYFDVRVLAVAPVGAKKFALTYQLPDIFAEAEEILKRINVKTLDKFNSSKKGQIGLAWYEGAAKYARVLVKDRPAPLVVDVDFMDYGVREKLKIQDIFRCPLQLRVIPRASNIAVLNAENQSSADFIGTFKNQMLIFGPESRNGLEIYDEKGNMLFS